LRAQTEKQQHTGLFCVSIGLAGDVTAKLANKWRGRHILISSTDLGYNIWHRSNESFDKFAVERFVSEYW